MIDLPQNFYYEPPSRLLLVDKLEHLARYSDFLVVVTGAEGSGKTTVIKRFLKNSQGESVKHVALSLTGETNDQQLASLCASVLIDKESIDADPLTQVYEQCLLLQEVGKQLLIVIDNAEWLNDEAVELLAGLLMTGMGRPKVVLSGEKSITSRLESLSINELLEGRLHIEDLQPFESEECKEFLQLGFSEQAALSKKQFSQVLGLSEGYPGKLIAAVEELKNPKNNRVKKARSLPLPPIHLMGIAATLILVLGLSLWKFYPEDVVKKQQVVDNRVSVPLSVSVPEQDQIKAQIEDIKSTRSELAKRLEEQEKLLAAQLTANQADNNKPVTNVPEVKDINNSPSEQAQISEQEKPTLASPAGIKENISDPRESNKPVTQITQTVKENTEKLVSDNSLAKKAAEKKAAEKKAAEKKAAEKKAAIKKMIAQKVAAKKAAANKSAQAALQAKPKAVPVISKPKQIKPKPPKPPVVKSKPSSSNWLREKELLAWPKKGFTLQVLGARSGESVEEFMATKTSRDKLYYFSTIFKGKPWHVVVYGQYSSREAAKKAVASLPQELRALKPWPRTILGVQKDIKKK